MSTRRSRESIGGKRLAVKTACLFCPHGCFAGLAFRLILNYQMGHMVRFTIFGIPVRVEPFFWVVLVLIGGAQHANSAAAIFKIALFVLAGFISVLLHELGHALTARKFGAYSEIVLQAFGGYASYTGVRLSRPQTLAVTAAGPLVQLLLGVIIFFAIPHLPGLSANGRYFLFVLMGISVVWSLLNLLPVLPLDGGQLLNTLLGPRNIKLTLWISIVVAAIAAVLTYQYTGSIMFPLFLGMFAWQAFQGLKENPRG